MPFSRLFFVSFLKIFHQRKTVLRRCVGFSCTVTLTSYSLTYVPSLLFSFIYLICLCGMWHLGSLTRDRTAAPAARSMDLGQPLDRQESSALWF